MTAPAREDGHYPAYSRTAQNHHSAIAGRLRRRASAMGIFAGILLRVRAFLFLGVAFLVLAVVTMIGWAAVDLRQTWLWYVSGIVLGAAIITVFALFEKKRQEILGMVEKLKQWDG